MPKANEEVPQFRELYTDLMRYEGRTVNEDVLAAWLPKARQALDTLQQYRRMNSPQNNYAARHEDRWQWYALSRVNDLLLLGFQAREDFYVAPASKNASFEAGARQGHRLPIEEYVSFFEALGFRSYTRLPYSPFHFEIVEVVETPGETATEGNNAGEISVDHVFWPGLMFGEMLFSRAGVRGRCPSRLIRKAVAETSRLYFTHRRLWRQTMDESVGWGSNSQWRTCFRRDYDSGGHLCYNVDGEHLLGSGYRSSFSPRLGEEEDDLTLAERIEVLTNRCFVRCQKDDSDLFPFNDRYVTEIENSV